MIFEIRHYIATSNKDDSSLDQFPFLLGHPVAFYREFEVPLKQILNKNYSKDMTWYSWCSNVSFSTKLFKWYDMV